MYRVYIYGVFRTYTVRVYRNPKKNIGNLFAVDIPCTYTADQNCHGLGKTKIACVRIYRGYPVTDPNRQRKNLAGRPKFDKRYKVQKNTYHGRLFAGAMSGGTRLAAWLAKWL